MHTPSGNEDRIDVVLRQHSPTRILDVGDVLSYLDAIKRETDASTYGYFLDIMKDYQTSVIDTKEVCLRVAALLQAYPELVRTFNVFVPMGWFIEVDDDGSVYVHSPQGLVSPIAA
ncbi:hypothetical protein M408DRAFT_21301 [Serendipita vermifera MAFF 305830]|uniref:PAH2 domain-containing protein n=1 Tax=Serendipita vermifera MAFF 305830 TaxID=933852 RepID=A0A0C2XQK0_SERVB|nr:hypothetical protein M408DRAFT_21301 [Serendipita vermifera MAFF 305830]